MRILGIDPGSNATGYGVVDQSGGKLIHVAHGIIRPPKDV
ncbi:MAG: crossover junction endodeoxyribonuclease RuvC, partial [Myxococcales bacterium]